MNFTRALVIFLRLQFVKLLLRKRVLSSFDLDRLTIEYLFSYYSCISNGRIFFVGLHERSFLYQLVIPAVYADKDDKFICKWIDNVHHQDAMSINLSKYDYVVLSGVYGYGTDDTQFRDLLIWWNRKGKTILVFDWFSNYGFHAANALLLNCSIKIRKIKRQLYCKYK